MSNIGIHPGCYIAAVQLTKLERFRLPRKKLLPSGQVLIMALARRVGDDLDHGEEAGREC